MEIVAKCPQCDAGLPIRASDAPDAIKCGACGHEMPLSFSPAVRADEATDLCPVCAGADFYIRKDFNPKLGLTIVIIGASISGIFYYFKRDFIAYSILAFATLIDLAIYGRLKARHRLLPLPHGIPRRVSTHRAGLRSAHGGCARAGVRCEGKSAGVRTA